MEEEKLESIAEDEFVEAIGDDEEVIEETEEEVK